MDPLLGQLMGPGGPSTDVSCSSRRYAVSGMTARIASNPVKPFRSVQLCHPFQSVPGVGTDSRHHGDMSADMTPQQAFVGHADRVPDGELPGLAARWLAEGYDSPTLVELAGLSRRDGVEARRLLREALAELGFAWMPLTQADMEPWKGRWDDVSWAVRQMDQTHSPYASAQILLEIAEDVPELWDPLGGDTLMRLLETYDRQRDRRDQVLDAIRTQLRSLREEDVPPLPIRRPG